jgi:tetraacyldisaccharide 4'-kinase
MVLLPFSLLYGAAVSLRNWFFEIGLLPVVKVSVPVVSVGNISSGGTGKTPLVQFLAENLKKRKKLAVISRGYRRKGDGYLVVSNGRQRCAEAEKAGDEPSQMAERLDDVVVIVDERRVRAAQRAIQDFGVEMILLDDGFQHRYLHRDLDIVIVSAKEIVRGDFLLPAGNRREPISALQRADILGISGCDSAMEYEKAKNALRESITKPMFGFCLRFRCGKNAQTRKTEDLSRKKAVAFSGIGNPSGFERTLISADVDVVRHFVFPDHHWYSEKDFQMILKTYRETKADVLVTTEKDIARFNHVESAFLRENPVLYVEVEPDIVAGKDILMEIISGV